jgi:hypothetical protein
MIIARTRRAYSLSPWLAILLGAALFIVGGLNVNYNEVKASPVLWGLVVCFLITILFVLPFRKIGAYQEIMIEKSTLKLIKRPANKEAVYDLKILEKWSVKPSAGRYDYGQNLYLVFLDGYKLHVSEMEYTNFNAVIGYLKSKHGQKQAD